MLSQQVGVRSSPCLQCGGAELLWDKAVPCAPVPPVMGGREISALQLWGAQFGDRAWAVPRAGCREVNAYGLASPVPPILWGLM